MQAATDRYDRPEQEHARWLSYTLAFSSSPRPVNGGVPSPTPSPDPRALRKPAAVIAYEDIETPNSFIFVEEWENLDDVYRHFRTRHFTEFFGVLPQVLAGPPDGSVHEVASTLTLNDALVAGGVSP
jgi:hypothetical protein